MLSLIVGFFPVLFICVVLHLFTFGYEPTEVLLQYSAYIFAVAFMFRKVPFRFTSADFTVIGFCVVSMTTALSLLCLINFYAGISYASLFLPNLVVGAFSVFFKTVHCAGSIPIDTSTVMSAAKVTTIVVLGSLGVVNAYLSMHSLKAQAKGAFKCT